MTVSIAALPRDLNGIVQGAWLLLHSDPAFCGTLGNYDFSEGASTVPATGRALQCVIGEYGRDLYAELWPGEFPAGYALPELISRDVPASDLAHFERCPWRDASPSGDADAVADITPSTVAASVSPDDETTTKRRRR